MESKSSAMTGATSSDTRGSFVASERKFSETGKGRMEDRNVRGKDLERNVQGFLGNVGERRECKEEEEEVKYKEKKGRFGNGDRETIKNISGKSKLHRTSHSRSRSGSVERKDGATMSRNQGDSGTRKESCKKLKESDSYGGKHRENTNRREHGRRNVRHNARSSSDDSSRERTTRNFERDESTIVRRRRSQNGRGRRSTSRDSRGRRGSRDDSSSERDRSRSRSIGLKCDRSRRRTTNRRGRRSTSRDNEERRTTRRRSTSCSSDSRRSRSWGIKERRSISMDNKERRSTSKDNKGRRSTSRNNKERRSTSEGRRRQRSKSYNES